MRHSGNMGKPSEMKINKAAGEEPKRSGGKPAHAAGVGNERKADVRGAQDGGDRAEAGGMASRLDHAVRELHDQHPHAHDAHGPHHGTSDHIRHKPMHKG